MNGTAHEPSFYGMVGRSEAMRQVFAQIRRVGPADTTVTIVGASGTGKELAARALHDLSPRRIEAFIAVNCGAIPANLAEAEFFGYEKGAFTGAQRQHIGISSARTAARCSSTRSPRCRTSCRSSSCACSRPAASSASAAPRRFPSTCACWPRPTAIRCRRCRTGTCARTSITGSRCSCCACPCCACATTTSSCIAQDLLDSLNRKYGTAKAFGAGSIAAMRAAAWPGNVRELRNCVERAFIMSEDIVDIDCQRSDTTGGIRVGPDGCIRVPVGSTVADAEREMILATISHCGGNKRKAAELLGVSLKTIYNKLTVYGAAGSQLRLA